MSIIYEDAFSQVIETVTANGKTVQAINKAGSPGANRETLQTRAETALAANQAYALLPAIPAGAALTTTQLTTVVRMLRAELNVARKQNSALIRFILGRFDDVSDT